MPSRRARLKALESKLSPCSIDLLMPSGQHILLPGGSKTAGKLLGACMHGASSPEQQKWLDLIAQSEESVESDGGHLIELARAILNSPHEEEE
jgi:hypothetical protein